MNETLELPGVPPVPKKRGRPSTGKAKTAAQRKREQRRRGVAHVVDATVEQIRSMPVTTLFEQAAHCLSNEMPFTGKKLAAEIMRRMLLIPAQQD